MSAFSCQKEKPHENKLELQNSNKKAILSIRNEESKLSLKDFLINALDNNKLEEAGIAKASFYDAETGTEILWIDTKKDIAFIGDYELNDEFFIFFPELKRNFDGRCCGVSIIGNDQMSNNLPLWTYSLQEGYLNNKEHNKFYAWHMYDDNGTFMGNFAKVQNFVSQCRTIHLKTLRLSSSYWHLWNNNFGFTGCLDVNFLLYSGNNQYVPETIHCTTSRKTVWDDCSLWIKNK